MIKETLRTALNEAVLQPWATEKGLTVPAYTLEEPPKGIIADFATNIALLAAKQLKTNPRNVAQELAALISKNLDGMVQRVEIAGAGFLNVTMHDRLFHEQLAAIRTSQGNYGKKHANATERILIEFVSANPTGPLHIGHGRGAAIGDSLARIFTHCGFTVEREYYLNDVGNQMNMLGLSLEARYRETRGETVDFPQDGYKGQYLIDIARSLPAGTTDFKQAALDAMMATIEKDLEGFGVSFDHWFSESRIAAERDAAGKTEVDKTCAWLQEKGFAFEQDGALWFATTRYGDDKDRVLRRSDGRYTYLASDIAYHQNKISRHYTRLINLWGADHHGYVARMKAAIEALGAPRELLHIILYQLVSLVRNGVPVAMSTRAGEFVTLEEVLQEVGKDACRFFFMLRAPDSPLEFDLELAKKQSSENPVFYVQYVRARCCSIFRENAARGLNLDTTNADPALLTAPEERALIKQLAAFSDVLDLCVKTLSPHHLTAYVMDVADLYHRFYEKCRVLGDDRALSAARLLLVECVAITIANSLALLGVSAPDKM